MLSTRPDQAETGGQESSPDAEAHRLELLVAAALAAINLSRWIVLIGDISPQLIAVAQHTADETLEELGVTPSADEAEALTTWAKQWAHDRAAELVDRKMIEGHAIATTEAEHDIARSTLDMIAGDVRDAITSGSTAAELADILAESPAFSPQRA